MAKWKAKYGGSRRLRVVCQALQFVLLAALFGDYSSHCVIVRMFVLDDWEMYTSTGACCDLYDDKDLASLQRHGKFTAPGVACCATRLPLLYLNNLSRLACGFLLSAH
jgi:hypothetical protein